MGAGVSWGVDASGDWGVASNWTSDPNLPGAGDDVTINRPVGGLVVTVSSGTQGARSLVGGNTLTLSGGTLDVTTTAVINGTLNVAGGTLQDATVSRGASGVITFTSGTLSNVTLASDIAYSNATLNVQTGLTLSHSNITVTSLSSKGGGSGLAFGSGNETLAGTGTVVFNGTFSGQLLGANVTLAPGIVVATGTGGMSLGPTGLVNQGTISSQTSGKTVTVAAGTWTNTGTEQATNGGTVVASVVPTNFSSGTLTGGNWVASGGTLRVPMNVTANAANITLDGSGNFYNAASGTNSALAQLSSNTGTLTVTGGEFLGPSASTLTNTGTIVVGAGSTLSVNQVLMNGGMLAGSGTVFKSVHAGSGAHTIHPGMPGSGVAGTLTIPNVTTNGNTTLGFNLYSPDVGATLGVCDRLALTDKTGAWSLSGGAIQVTSSAGGAGSLGYYPIVQLTSAISGSLSSLTLPAPAGNVVYTLDAARDAGFIDLHKGFLGDANDDGRVDLTDLAVVLNNFGTGRAWASGDFDGAGGVDAVDLSDVLDHFGAAIPAGAAVAAAPEVGTVGVLGGVAVLMWRRRWTVRGPRGDTPRLCC